MTVLSATTTLEQTNDHDDNINNSSSILIAFDDDDEDSNELIPRKDTRNNNKAFHSNHRRRVIIENDEMDDDDSNDDNDNEDDDNDDTDFTVKKNDGSTKQQRRWKPPRPSTNAARKSFAARRAGATNSRQRRRSSARFIRLSQQNSKRNLIHGSDNSTPQDGDDIDDTVNDCDTTTSHLSELYNKAIQMNVENKINAGNSWNLRLIENIDQFLFEHDVLEEGDEEEEDDIDDDVNDDAIDKGIDNNDIGTPQTKVTKQGNDTSTNKKKRINFTKASCTLDASVKIYSYRVDDVHLTSYKVLANLNRSDNNVTNKNKQNKSHHDSDMNTTSHYNDDQNNDDDDSNGRRKKNSATKNSASTLETQIANININKLDSAFDIDPLFHKMSKSFDEGGAKGLLLHNLGVGTMGCNIVFDSTLDDDVADVDGDFDKIEKVVNVNHVNDDSEGTIEEADGSVPQVTEGMIDISSLTTHLRQLLESQNETLESIPIVPQLESLRAEYSSLEADGFIGDVGGIVTPLNQQRNKRRNQHQQFYEPDPEEEQEADRSIHQIALERTCRFSMTPAKHNRFLKSATTPTSLDGKYDNANHEDNCDDNADFDDDHHEGNAIDFGGHGDYDNGDDDFDYPRLSTFSFQQRSSVTGANQEANNLATANLLDALSAGNMLLGQNASSSDYFNINDVMKDSTNVWAGAAHWKRNNNVIQSLTTTAKKKATNKTRITKKIPMGDCNMFVPFHGITPDLSFLLEDNASKENVNMVGKGKRTRNAKKKTTTSTQTIQLSKAMITKYTNNENLLPEDAGVQVAALSQFFLRPNNSFIPTTDSSISNGTSSRPTPDIDYSSCNNTNNDGVNGVGYNNKVVSFGDINGWDDDNDSFGGGDDGPGFEFADLYDNDNFLLPTHELADVRKIEKIQVGYATVAKKVDVKRLKNDLWIELENKFGLSPDKNEEEKEEITADIHQHVDDDNDTDDINDNNDVEDSTQHQNGDVNDAAFESKNTTISFQDIIHDLEQQKSQQDVTLPFYFICVLHLANEKCLKLTSSTTDGLNDFSIEPDFGMK